MARDETQITLPEDENEKLKSSEEADIGPLTPNKPLDEIQITLTEDEINKLKLLKDTDTDKLTLNKPLIQKVPQILRSCYSEGECRRYFKPISVGIGPLNHQEKIERDLTLERGEKWKLRMATMFFKFCEGKEQYFYKNVKKEINSLRNCYNFKGQEWKDEGLAWRFLVDGCALLLFIILDVNDAWEDFRDENDLASIEKVDIFLLENQLPYQLLEILMVSLAECSTEEDQQEEEEQEDPVRQLEEEQLEELKQLLKKLINKFINKSFLHLTAQKQQEEDQQQQQEDQQQQQQEQEHPVHLLDLLRSFKKLITKFINKSFLHLTAQKQEEEDQQQQQEQEQEDPVHLLDLLRKRLMGVKSKKKGEKQEQKDGWSLNTLLNDNKSKQWLSIRNVKELKDKGIRFKAREKVDAITEIDFNDCCCIPTLTLAPILLHNTTLPLLLNLMAYELCPDFEKDCKITSHLSFLDSLIDNGEDVKELRDAGVLHHGLGSDEAVAELFNKISGILVPNLVINPDLKGQIHAYCNSSKSHFSGLRASIEAKLTHTYFRSPWSILVFFGALAGLVMTGMQTYYSFHENKLH